MILIEISKKNQTSVNFLEKVSKKNNQNELTLEIAAREIYHKKIKVIKQKYQLVRVFPPNLNLNFCF